MITQLIRASEVPIAFIESWLKPFLLLGIRLYIFYVFFRSGLTKVADWDTTLALFTDEYHVPLLPPALAAVMGAGGELLLSPLLALGIASRFAAAGLFVVNLMALISYPALFEFDCPAGVHQHFFWGTLMLVILCVGAGRFAFDAWVAGRAPARA